jgi:hypothetical protein
MFICHVFLINKMFSRKVDVTVDLLREYKDVIDDTTLRLEMHLQKISDQLDNSVPRSDEASGEEQEERQNMQDEKESTEQCLEICAEFLDHIERVQKDVADDISPASEPGQVHIATTSNRVTSRKIIVNTLDDLALRLESAKALLEKISNVAPKNGAGSSQERNAAQKDLEEELEGIKQSLEVCAEANETANSRGVHSFDRVSMDDDGLQVIVATMGDLLHVSDIKAGYRSAQIFGQMNDESLQKLSGDHVSAAKERATDTRFESDPHFGAKYGAGVRLDSGGFTTAGSKKK